MSQVGLQLTNLRKNFGGVAALRGVDFTARGGEVHALLGQNGSGKSTLVKILTGIYDPEPGASLQIWGRDVSMPLTSAHEHGIAVIHQDLGLVESMSVLENMGVASGYGARLFSPLSMARERRISTELLAELGLTISPDTLIADLPPASRATVAIARAMRMLREYSDRLVFVLDEPTAYLSAEESDLVVRLMRTVADAGNAVVFISHRLHEVATVADRVTVLRDGLVVDSFERADLDSHRIIQAMLGKRLDWAYPDRPPLPTAEPALTVSGLVGARVAGIDFAIRPGEVVGFAGLVGMGHEEVPELLAGAAKAVAGSIVLAGKDITQAPIAQRIEAGVSLVPGNRQRDGLWLDVTAFENLALLKDTQRPALTMRGAGGDIERAGSMMRAFGVRPPDPKARADQFSGGNQQKIVLAKWMSDQVSVLLLDEPTQGIDAGAKFDVLQAVCDAAGRGAMVLIASGDYEQLAQICHRVIVMRFGKVIAELSGDQLTETETAHTAQAAPVATVPMSHEEALAMRGAGNIAALPTDDSATDLA